MPEICPVDGELVVGVQLGFVGVVRRPGIAAAGFEDVHAVVHGWTAVVAEHVDLRWWRVVIGIGREDDVPVALSVEYIITIAARAAWWLTISDTLQSNAAQVPIDLSSSSIPLVVGRRASPQPCSSPSRWSTAES